jgi:intracellular sulfur oxidation DsrE/DsrF family protein
MLKSRFALVLWAAMIFAAGAASAQTAPALHIDIPVKLEKANVVFDVGKLTLNGDMPFLIGDIHLLANDYADGTTKGEIIAVFHGDAAYLILNDAAYNANRHTQTGNPYAKLLDGLMKQGVKLELCGATAAGNHWGNADLLPGVKVNTNAMVRVLQLEQQGYLLMYQ